MFSSPSFSSKGNQVYYHIVSFSVFPGQAASQVTCSCHFSDWLSVFPRSHTWWGGCKDPRSSLTACQLPSCQLFSTVALRLYNISSAIIFNPVYITRIFVLHSWSSLVTFPPPEGRVCRCVTSGVFYLIQSRVCGVLARSLWRPYLLFCVPALG